MKRTFRKSICIVLTAFMLLTAAPLSGFVGLEWPDIGFPNKGTNVAIAYAATSYKLSYNANGGSGTPSGQTGSTSYTISSVRPTRSGYTFRGWSSSSNTSTASYEPGDPISLSSDTTLYAVWQKTFYGDVNNDGNVNSSDTALLSNFLAQTATPNSLNILKGDLNGDGALTQTDLLILSQFCDGVKYSFPVEDMFGLASITMKKTDYKTGESIKVDSFNVLYTNYVEHKVTSGFSFTPTIASGSGQQIVSARLGDWGARMTITVDDTVGYTLTYNANGGSGAPSSQTGATSYTISSTVPTRFGYTFCGWSKSSSSTAWNYSIGDEITLTSDMTLYAVWSSAKSMSIGTSYAENISFANQERYYSFTPSSDGVYVFESNGSLDTKVYIYTSSGTELGNNDDGGENSNFRLSINLTAGTKYYIKVRAYSNKTGSTSFDVRKESFSLTYNANGGSGAPSSQTGATSYTIPKTEPVRSGYTFRGWAKSSSAATVAYRPGDTVNITSSTTLYAVWKKTFYGDVNNDGVVNDDDSDLLGKYVVKTLTPDSLSILKGDLNGDGVLSDTDMLILTQYCNKLIDKFPVEELFGLVGITLVKTTYLPGESIKKSDITFNVTYTNYVQHNVTTGFTYTPTVASGTDKMQVTATLGDWQAYYFITIHTHSYSSKITKAATCEVNGIKTYTCTACSDSYTESIPATGHKWTAADCDSAKTCSVCKKTDGSPLGHNYSSKITKTATCTENGIKTYTCSRCSDSYTESIPAAGHKWTAADCDSAKTCSVCKKTDGSPLGHNYSSKITKTATCTENGIKTYTCSRCSDTYTENINPISHVDNNNDQHCDYCNKSLVTEIIQSGTCGENLTWTLDKVGTLIISGTGGMTDYNSYSFAPWSSNRSAIKKAVIENGVTSIGGYVFWDCPKLTSVTIPDSVTNIGEDAFARCFSLISVTFGENSQLMSIGFSAFNSCTSLTSVTIPDSVTSIGDNAFSHCTSLTSVTIPDSVTSIGRSAFYNCTSLTDITVDADNTTYCSEDGVLFNKSKTELILCPIGNARTSYTIPDSVTSIGEYAFYWCTSLTSVTIGNSVTSIGDRAFRRCTSLTSVTIPDSVTSIGAYAFSDCTSLVEVYYAGSEEDWKNITIDKNGNENLINITPFYNFFPNTIVVFSTEKSLSLGVGDSMYLAFGVLSKGTDLLDENWRKMAIAVSDPTIISLSDYEETEYGYSLEVIGKKPGATNVTITDTETGLNTIIVISVYEEFVRTYSYAIDDMKEFYPNNKWEDHISTNIYNLNGLYVNNYKCVKNGNEYNVEFDVYNSKYYAGAVDIYSEDGLWLGYEEIDKYSDISSLWDTGEQALYLISNTVALIPGGNDSNLLTYEQESFSKHTHIKIKLKEGEYFTISNNAVKSPGTFLINAFEIIFDAAFVLLDLVTSDSVKTSAFSDFKLKVEESFEERLQEAYKECSKDYLKTEAQKIKLKSMQSEINKITKNFAKAEFKDKLTTADEFSSEIANMAENMLSAYNITWEHLGQSATGILESVISVFGGAAGTALKGCFAMTKGSNKLLMATQMAMSSENTYASVYTKIEEGIINQHGIIVNTTGNMDAEAVLQVFRVSDDDAISVLLDSENPLQSYEMYNICFTKNDNHVQPNGKVKVHIPIPHGMLAQTCKVYRQENDGSWTILNAHVEGTYLVFETDHFSMYSVIGDKAELTIEKLPDQLVYLNNSVLNTDGLLLSLNGVSITDGYICTPTVLSKNGSHTITVHYGHSSTEFEVIVLDLTLGDVDENGKIEAADARLALRAAVNLESLTEAQLSAADADKNGKIEAADARLILRAAVGLDTLQ